MQSALATKAGHRLVSLATFVLVVAVLSWGKDVILPIALASLITFLLTPVVVRLHRWGLPKPLAIISSVLIAFSVITTVGGIVAWQLADLATELPNYERNIHQKVSALKEAHGPPAWQRTMEMLQQYSAELQDSEPVRKPTVDGEEGPKPVPVEVLNAQPSSFNLAQSILGPLLSSVALAGIVIVFVVAMLFQREDLRDRFIQVVSAGRLNVATEAVNDAARRVSRYLLMQLVVNATYGIPIGLGLYFIGIPNALLWGLLATLLRFIPFLGPWIAAIFPVVLAIAVDPGYKMLLLTLALYVVMELVSNNVIEIVLYRAGTGISNLALLVAAVFWTWLWGPIGLFLSTPLTACILVIGRYVPSLRLLSTLLGSEPVLKPASQFYQRMLSMDRDEMDDRAHTFVERRSLLEFFSEVLVPALLLAEEDRHRGALAEVRQRFILSSVRELIEDLDRTHPFPITPKEEPSRWASSARVIVVPAGDDADELVGLMLATVLRRRGADASVAPVALSPAELEQTVREAKPDIVIVSALPPHALSQAGRACRTLQGIIEDRAPMIVGVWQDAGGARILHERLPELPAVVTHLDEAIEEAQRQIALQHTTPPFADETPAPVTTIPPLNLAQHEPAAWIDLVTRDLAGAFDVPLSLVAVVDLKKDFWPEEMLGNNTRPLADDVYLPLSPRGRLESGEDVLTLEDVSRDERFSHSRITKERGIQFYAGAVLRASSGEIVGAIVIVDTKPRAIDDEEKLTLRARAREMVASAEAQFTAETATADVADEAASIAPTPTS